MILTPGTIVDDKFVIRGLIGTGGMGAVYEAMQLNLDRIVAIKLLVADSYSDAADSERFEREAAVLAAIAHKSIVQVFAYGVWQRQQYLAMERLSGVSLEDRLIDAPAGLGYQTSIAIGLKLCDALTLLHSKDVIHRDIKPANVITLDKDCSEVKLIDFGLALCRDKARLTQTGSALGSAPYMSPEQCLGRTVDNKSDIYSLGCLLYECFTGVPPFAAADPATAMFRHLNDPLDSAERWDSVPDEVQRLFEICLNKQPQNRYTTAAELSAALTALPATPTQQTRKKRPTRKRLPLLITSLCVVALLGMVAFLLQQHAASTLTDQATDTDALQEPHRAGPEPSLFTNYKSAMTAAFSMHDAREYASAIKLFNRAIELKPLPKTRDELNDEFDIYARLTACLRKTRQSQKAVAAANKAVSIAKRLGLAKLALAYSVRSEALAQSGDRKAALKDLNDGEAIWNRLLKAPNHGDDGHLQRGAFINRSQAASLYWAEHNCTRAQQARVQQLKYALAQTHQQDILRAYREKSETHLDCGDLAEAKNCLEQWHKIADLGQDEIGSEETSRELALEARLNERTGNLKKAAMLHQKAVDTIAGGRAPDSGLLSILAFGKALFHYSHHEISEGDEAANLANKESFALDPEVAKLHQRALVQARARATAVPPK